VEGDLGYSDDVGLVLDGDLGAGSFTCLWWVEGDLGDRVALGEGWGFNSMTSGVVRD